MKDEIRYVQLSLFEVEALDRCLYDQFKGDAIAETLKSILSYVTGFKAGLDVHDIKQIHFPPPIDRSIHKLTIDGYYTVHSSSVCFPRGLFLWPVWHPRVHRCSLNGPGAS